MIHLGKEKRKHVFEWLYQTPGKDTFSAIVEIKLIQYASKECIRVLVNNRTDKSLAEKQLVKAESDLQILSKTIDQSTDSIMITDQHARIIFINPVFTRITGHTEEEAIGKNPSMLKSGVQNSAFYESMWKDLRQGKTWNSKLVDRRKNGEFFPADLTITPIMNDTGEVINYVGIKRDLKKHEELENKFRHAQKMKAVGIMVGDIAHDFNNVLGGITGNLYVAKQSIQSGSKLMKQMHNIEQLFFEQMR